MSLDTPTPPSQEETPDESLEALRAQLKAQRAEQRASLAKHKRTTYVACKVATEGTTYYDPAKLRECLGDFEDSEEPEEGPQE